MASDALGPSVIRAFPSPLAVAGLSGTSYSSDVPVQALWGSKYTPISPPFAAFLADCAAGTLPQVAFVDSRTSGSDPALWQCASPRRKSARPVAMTDADVDGTLVTQDKVFTRCAIQAVHTLHDVGIAFAISSGRPSRGMTMLIEPLALTTPIPGFNGGMFVRPDMTIIEQHVLPASVTARVIKPIDAHGLTVWVYQGTEWFVQEKDAPHVAREESTFKFPPTVVPSFERLWDNVVKIVGVRRKAWRGGVRPRLAVLPGEAAVSSQNWGGHSYVQNAPGPEPELRNVLGVRLAWGAYRVHSERCWGALGAVLQLVQQRDAGDTAEGAGRRFVAHRGISVRVFVLTGVQPYIVHTVQREGPETCGHQKLREKCRTISCAP